MKWARPFVAEIPANGVGLIQIISVTCGPHDFKNLQSLSASGVAQTRFRTGQHVATVRISSVVGAIIRGHTEKLLIFRQILTEKTKRLLDQGGFVGTTFCRHRLATRPEN